MNQDEIETLAQALYSAEECTRGWHREPDVIKERYRRDACAALAALDEYRRSNSLSEKVEKFHMLAAGVPWLAFIGQAAELV